MVYWALVYQTTHMIILQKANFLVPTLMADADDTAKTIISLNVLGKRVRPDRLIEVFENGGHFRTYAGERNPSFSANCNILSALLHGAEPGQYLREIELALRFLCDIHSSGDMRDKWVRFLFPLILNEVLLTPIRTHAISIPECYSRMR